MYDFFLIPNVTFSIEDTRPKDARERGVLVRRQETTEQVFCFIYLYFLFFFFGGSPTVHFFLVIFFLVNIMWSLRPG